MILAATKFYWISKTKPSRALVLSIRKDETIKPPQFYPEVSYLVDGERMITTGTYNLPVQTGQVVDIVYDPETPEVFMINKPYWLWYDIWSWYRLVLVVIAIYYLVLLMVKWNAAKKKTEIVAPSSTRSRLIRVLLLLLLPISLFVVGLKMGNSILWQIGLVSLLGFAGLYAAPHTKRN